MLTLRELQADFARAILHEDARAIADAVVPDGLSPADRIQVYRHHIFASLGEALETTYPVVCRLVDRRFFGFAADAYVRSHPPAGPCLFEYGATFPAFLASFPPCAGHPYLGDVARLEWAMNAALHAPDVPAIDPTALGAVAPDDVGRLVVRMDPSAAWLESPWPIDRIWRANQPDADPDAVVDLSAGAARLEVRRQADVVTMRSLTRVELVFRTALARRATLEEAADLAITGDPGYDLTEAIRALLADALLTGFTLAGEGGGIR